MPAPRTPRRVRSRNRASAWDRRHIAANDPALIGRDRRELGVPDNRITANIDSRVRRRAQMRIERDPLPLRRYFAGGEVEAVDIGDPPCPIDDAVGLGHALGPALFIDDAETV